MRVHEDALSFVEDWGTEVRGLNGHESTLAAKQVSFLDPKFSQ